MLSRRIAGLIHLFRPELPLAAGICTVCGQVLALGRLPPFWTGILAFTCVFCLSASALILNDLFDYEVDKINAPSRPLPSGMVSKTDVVWLGAAVTLVGLLSALALSLVTLLAAGVIWLIGFLYNWRYKQAGLIGNLMVAFSVACTFLFGAISVQAAWNGSVWIFSLMAFFIDLGEEIAGDAMDMEGDQRRSSRSLALQKGKHFAVRTAVACWVGVILLGLLPVWIGTQGWLYLTFILATDVLIVIFSIRLLQSKTPAEGRRAMRGVYLGATLCVLAFLLGRLAG
ncbi:MAG TPA: UbiA family prenyltransferase [Anaerolineaceae bacterium]